MYSRALSILITTLFLTVVVEAQNPIPPSSRERVVPQSTPIVPRLIRFGGVVKDETGKPKTGITGLTFSLYRDQDSGAALWIETQNVTLDAKGHYDVLLGANTADGIPMDLFESGEAKWLGVRPESQSEQQRILLLSVPYAFKAADADTLGGKPASAFVLASRMPTQATKTASSGPVRSEIGLAGPLTVGGSGTTNFIPRWTSSTNLGNSIMFQSGTSSLRWGSPSLSSELKTDQGGSMELGALNLSKNPVTNGTPYIDFHFGNGKAEDFNARILNDADNDLLFSTAAGSTIFSLNASGVTVNGGVHGSGTGIKHARTGQSCTAPPTGTCSITLTWPGAPFADTNYTVVCTPQGTFGVSSFFVYVPASGKTTANAKIFVQNTEAGASAALNGAQCIAMHD